MAEQVYYRDIAVGDLLPERSKHPTKKQLVQWAVASGDLNDIHYDRVAALAANLPDVIVHGRLKAAFLTQYVADWVGPSGHVNRVSCSYRGTDVPGSPLTVGGRVVEKTLDGSEHRVSLELWIENASGQRTTLGSAVVTLPGLRSPSSLQ